MDVSYAYGYMDDSDQTGKGDHGYNSMMWNNSYMDYSRQPDCILQFNPWLGWRVGEAGNPGPTTVAGLNTQSLNAFVDDGRLCNGGYDVTVFTETAATLFVQQKACKTAHAKSKHLVCSSPVPKRHFTDNRDCNTRGQARGAAILSALPVRPLAQPWSQNNWNTARVVDSLLVHQHGCFVVVAVYGYHQGLPDADLHNEELLREAVQRTMTHDYPALIVGDLNCNVQDLAVWQDMVDSGWNDAALVQQSRDGEEPKLTYKETSRIDYILFNRKALPAFLNFSVSAQAETDHKTVVAEFDWTALPTVRNVYKMPVNLDYLQLDKQRILDAYLPAAHRQALATALQAGYSCKAWDTFCEAYEATLEFLFAGEDDIHFGARFRGRGKLRFKKQQDQGPIRRARCGEFDPTGDEVSTTLRQRIRQIRRLDTYISQSRKLQQTAPDDIKWPALHNAVLATWSAIVRSSGFQGQFAHWWLREVGPAFPLHPPDSSQALWMYETMRDLEPQWRSACRKYRSHNIMQVFNQDWKQGASKHFSAVKPPGAPRVDSLDVFTPIHITACRSRRKGSQRCYLQHDDMQCVKVGTIWKQAKAEARVVSCNQGIILLKNIRGNMQTGEIHQYAPTAIPGTILNEAKTFWNQFWNMKRDEPADDAMIQEGFDTLPQLPEMQTGFTMVDLEWAMGKLQVGKAKGMDGFSNFEIRNMPLSLRPFLLELLNLFTTTGKWPAALSHARMALLNKTETVGDISSTRPITILATVYRLWGKMMTRKMLDHVLPHLPQSLFGSVPGRCAADMTAAIQLQMEEALLTKTDLAGISLDFSKAYNTLSRPLLECINTRLGMQKAWTPYVAFLDSLKRHFTCGGSWGQSITSTVGVPEGCPVAVVQMILLTWTFTAFIGHKTGVQIYSYVDDWMMLTKQPGQLVVAIQSLNKLAKKFGLILSLPKSHVFSILTKTARAIRGNLIHHGISIGTAKNFQSLGINLQTTHKVTVDMRNKRWNRAKVLLNRLQYMPWDRRRKSAILVRGIFPLIFFGVQCWPTGKDFLREVRAKCNHTVWGKQQYHLHFTAPLFSGYNYEPMLLVAAMRFRAFMRLFVQHQTKAMEVWKYSIQQKAFFKNKTKGIVGLFQNQLHELDWAISPDGMCHTADGWSFCIWDITTAQFEQRLFSSWEDKLLPHLQQKQYLGDLQSFSISRSEVPRHKDVMMEGFINKMRLGGLFPNTRKHKVHSDNDQHCVFCGAIDTMMHRVYQCPGTQHLRDGPAKTTCLPTLWCPLSEAPNG